jgi:hypothetical protein
MFLKFSIPFLSLFFLVKKLFHIYCFSYHF